MFRPLASVKLCAAGSVSGLGRAAPGAWLRQASSAFSDSRSPFKAFAALVGMDGVGTSGGSTCSPGWAITTTRCSFCSHRATVALTLAGVAAA